MSPGSAKGATPPGAAERPRVAYVLTHYPRVSLTFVHDEIAMVEESGVEVHPFAMNLPAAADLRDPRHRAERDRTTYLKASWGTALMAWLGCVTRRPLAVIAVTAGALRSFARGPGSAVRVLAHVAQAALLAKHCRARGIRHVHAHFAMAPATIAWLGSRIAGLDGEPRSFSFTLHGFYDFAEPAVARLDLKAEAAAFVACISDFTRAQLCMQAALATWPKFEVIRCGIDLERLAWRTPPVRPWVKLVTVGRLAAEKGLPVLFEALSAIDPGECPLECMVVGDGELHDELADLARRLGIVDRVTFTGELLPEEVARQLDASDIFCLPSFSEGLPVSIMEAMARGVPVITTAIAGIPELAVNGETALVVPPANAEALRAAIETLAGDFELRARLARRAREAVAERHDRRKTARQLADLFERALDDR